MVMSLAEAPLHREMIVISIIVPEKLEEIARQLEEIGFLVGERVMVLNKVIPGGDPIAVRVGLSTFALRKLEATCVKVSIADKKANKREISCGDKHVKNG